MNNREQLLYELLSYAYLLVGIMVIIILAPAAKLCGALLLFQAVQMSDAQLSSAKRSKSSKVPAGTIRTKRSH
jgi:hypothetical protein